MLPWCFCRRAARNQSREVGFSRAAPGDSEGSVTHWSDSDEELDPVSPETYRQILEYEGLTASELVPAGCGSPDGPLTPDERLIRLDLSHPVPKAAWSGHFWTDWWCMNRNIIPYICLCFTSPYHPYDARERCAVFVVQILFCVLVSQWAALAEACLECEGAVTCSDEYDPMVILGIHKQTSTRNFTKACNFSASWEQMLLSDHCCTVSVTAAGWCFQNLSFGNFSFGGVIFTGSLNMLFAFVSNEIMKCGCVQSKPWRARKKWELAGHACFVFIAIAFIIQIPPMLYFLWKSHEMITALFNFIAGQVVAFFSMLAVGTVLFMVLWALQMPHAPDSSLACFNYPEGSTDTRNTFAKLLNPRFHVAVVDYEACLGAGRPSPRYAFQGGAADVPIHTWNHVDVGVA